MIVKPFFHRKLPFIHLIADAQHLQCTALPPCRQRQFPVLLSHILKASHNLCDGFRKFDHTAHRKCSHQGVCAGNQVSRQRQQAACTSLQNPDSPAVFFQDGGPGHDFFRLPDMIRSVFFHQIIAVVEVDILDKMVLSAHAAPHPVPGEAVIFPKNFLRIGRRCPQKPFLIGRVSLCSCGCQEPQEDSKGDKSQIHPQVPGDDDYFQNGICHHKGTAQIQNP